MQPFYKPLPIDAGYIFLGILLVLILANLVGGWLKKRHPHSYGLTELVRLFCFWAYRLQRYANL